MRSASEVEQNIVSVERILHYIKLDPEAPYEKPENKPEESWPVEGAIASDLSKSEFRLPALLLPVM